jgi:hypothetical protein
VDGAGVSARVGLIGGGGWEGGLEAGRKGGSGRKNRGWGGRVMTRM